MYMYTTHRTSKQLELFPVHAPRPPELLPLLPRPPLRAAVVVRGHRVAFGKDGFTGEQYTDGFLQSRMSGLVKKHLLIAHVGAHTTEL